MNLDVESNINISKNSRVAGISLTQGNTVNNTYTTESHTWDNNISVTDSTVTSGSVTTLELLWKTVVSMVTLRNLVITLVTAKLMM